MSADGRIKIDIEVDGKQVGTIVKNLNELEDAGKRSGQGVKSAEENIKKAGKESDKTAQKIKKIATALGLVAIGTAAFKMLKSSVDAAISRFDTLNRFPKVLQALGVSAEDSEKSLKKLADGIEGLPTTLNEIAANAQRMYTTFSDMDKATDTALALNNALLGSGSSAQDAQRGAEQYMQALQRGKFEMEEWKTLQETMDVGLIKIAESFGYTGKTAKQDLYQALKDGVITMDQFNDKLIEVGTGTGIMAQLAKENSLGIATSLGNLRNAFAKGIANIIDSMNRLSKETTGKDIAENIDSLKGIVNASFKAIGNVIEKTSPIVKGLVNVLGALLSIVKILSPALIGLASALAIHTIVHKTVNALKSSETVIKAVTVAMRIYNLAILENTTGHLSNIAAEKLSALATKAKTAALNAAIVAELLFTRQIKLSQVALLAKAAATTVLSNALTFLSNALKFLTGPVGWVTAGIGALAGATVAIIKWFKRETEEAKKLKAETEKLAEATDKLKDSVDEATKTYKNNRNEIFSNASANQELVKRISEISAKEKKSIEDKILLARYVDQLNESVQGLNLTYDENSDALSMSTEQIKARVDIMKEEELLTAAQERLVEIAKERNEIDLQLSEINKLREEWNQKLEVGAIKSNEYKEAISQLDEQENSLMETLNLLAAQQVATEEQIKTSTEAIATAIESGVIRQKIAYEDLTEAQQRAVDGMKSAWESYEQAATEMFDTLSDEAELTVAEMTKNLEENQRIISEWAENIARLAERGVDEGLLEKLREAGPQSAGHVKALVNASDEELQKLNEIFKKGGETATKALAKSLGIDETGVMDAIEHLVANTEASLREQVEAANFPDVGKAVADGYGVGISKGTADVKEVVRDMADITTETAKKELGIHSPSTVFKEIGGDVTEGMALGVTEGTSSVVKKMQELLTSAVAEFKNVYSKFHSIGSDAMSGLKAGLNAGKSSVLSTARSIANQVTSTMQSALRIQSPSKVMRDKVGKWIPAGIAEGIEDNVSSVYKALNKLSYATPEIALGTHRMAYSGVNVSSISSGNIGGASTIPQSGENDGGLYEFHLSIPLDGEIIAKKTVRFTARELESMRKQEKRGRGYR